MSEKQRAARRVEEAVREVSPWIEQFALVGSFLVVAALRFEPGKAGSLHDAFQTLLQRPFESWILGVVALGLVAYGLLMIAETRYSSHLL
jgi:hypothetical protein